jgi:hypothetical protein
MTSLPAECGIRTQNRLRSIPINASYLNCHSVLHTPGCLKGISNSRRNTHYTYACIYIYIPNFMKVSSSSEAVRCTAIQELPNIAWNPTVRQRFHKSSPLVRIWVRSMQSMPRPPSSLRSILILSTHLRLGLSSRLFPSGFPTNTLIWFPSPFHSCYIPCPSDPHPPLHTNYAWRRVSSLCSFSNSCCSVPIFCSAHPSNTLKHPQSIRVVGFLDFVQRSQFWRPGSPMFGKVDLIPSWGGEARGGEGRETSILLDLVLGIPGDGQSPNIQ